MMILPFAMTSSHFAGKLEAPNSVTPDTVLKVEVTDAEVDPEHDHVEPECHGV